ncbi:MAG TPA: hypothetical protein VFK06_23315 [Candidatus Angelobacter sp.]|nr:hypothetical protein [Candidatus Angelobacter sp.]
MLRRLLLVVISGTWVYLSGQAVNSGVTAGTGTVVAPGTYVVNGYVTTVGNGQIVTPTAAFDTPAPTAGVSNAGRAGISNNAPLSNGALSVTPPSSIAFTNAAPVVSNAAPAEGNSGQAAAPANQASAIGDFGPSYFAGAESAASATGPVSLAEMATQYKSQAVRSGHTYTNADIEQIASKNSGVVLTNNTRTVSLPSGGASSNAQTAQNTAPAPQPTTPQDRSQSATQPNSQASQENPNSATTPRINQPQPQPGSREGESKRLPATATLLPLLGLIGILTGGFGLYYYRPRR